MRWLRRPVHLTNNINNINPNIYRFLRQRGCKQQLLFRMKFAQFALRRLVSLIGSIARTRQFGQLLQKENETWRNMPLQRDSRALFWDGQQLLPMPFLAFFYTPIPWQHYMAIYFWRLRLTEMLSTNTQSQIIINIRWYMMSFLKINKIF